MMNKDDGQLSGKKIRLTIVTNNIYAFGGGEKWALELSKRLSRKFDIKIVNTYSKGEKVKKTRKELEEEYDLRSFEIIDLDSVQMKSSAFGKEEYVMRIPRLKSVISLFNIIKNSDVVYQVSLNPVVFSYSLIFSKSLGKKFIFGVHNPVFFKIFEGKEKRSGLLLSLLRQVRFFHVINSSDFELVKKHFPKAKIYKISIFITKNYLEPRSNNKEFVVLYVGRFAKDQKGIDILDKIVKKVISKEDRIRFHMVGGGGDGEKIIYSLGDNYKKNVKVLGFVNEKKLDEEYKNASLFILPSRYEGLPAVLIEAQTYGLPVVAFDVKGPSDIVRVKRQGTLIKPFNTENVTDNIIEYFKYWKKNPSEYSKIKIEVSNLIYIRYKAVKILRKMEKMISDIYSMH